MAKFKFPFGFKLSVKHESLLRKFTIVFFTLYFLPLMIMFFLVHNVEIDSTGFAEEFGFELDKNVFDRLFMLFLISALVTFYWGKRIFGSLVHMTQKAEEIAKGELGKRIDGQGDKEIIELARSFNDITRKLEENLERLKMSKKTVQEVLYRISTGMADATKNMETFLRLILDTTMSAVDARRGALVMLTEDDSSLYIRCSRGYSEEALKKKIKVDSEEGWVIKSAKPVIVPRVGEETEPAICVPLKYKERTIGAISFSGRIGDVDFSQDDAMLLSNIASQTAVAIANERLNLDAEQTYKQTISALALAVEARDAYSRGHSDRVSKYAVKIAKKIGLDEKIINNIQDAAELHDVGKIGIEDEILRKAGTLTPEETKIMRNHPVIGESIVRPIRSLVNLCDLIRHHHEFLDGSGYPDGLKAEELSLGARVLAVADAFDAMTTDRPYRKARTFQEAIAELRKFANSHYDPKVIDVFAGLLQEKKEN